MARQFRFQLILDTIVNSKGFKDFEKSIVKGSNNIGKSLQVTGKRIDALGKKSTALGKSLSLKLTAPLVGLGALSAKAFGDFEDGFNGVVTLLDNTSFDGGNFEKGVDGLRQGVLDLNSDLALGLDKLNKALFDTVSAGVDAGEAINAVAAAGKLAVAGLTDVSVATDGITSALNAFNLNADKAEAVAAKFFTAQKAGKTTVEDLAGGLGLVAANAQSAGISLEETLGAVSAITLGGVRTNAAFTGLKAALANISRPSKQAAAEAKRLGIEFNTAAVRTQGLEGFITNLVKNPNFGPDTISKLFRSTDAQASLNALINKVDLFRKTTAQLSDDAQGVETLSTAFARQDESFGRTLKKLRERFTNFAVRIGEVLAPTFNKFANAVDSALKQIEKNPALIKLGVAAGTAVAALGPLLLIFGQFASVLSSVIGVVAKFSTALSAAVKSGGLLTTIFDALVIAARTIRFAFSQLGLAIATIGLAVVKIQKETGAYTELLKVLFSILKNVVSAFVEFTGLGTAASGIFKGFSLILTGLTKAFKFLVSTTTIGLTAILQIVTKLLIGIKAIPGVGNIVPDEAFKRLLSLESRLGELRDNTTQELEVTLGLRDQTTRQLQENLNKSKAELAKRRADRDAKDAAAAEKLRQTEEKLQQDKIKAAKLAEAERAKLLAQRRKRLQELAEFNKQLDEITVDNNADLGQVNLDLVAKVERDKFEDALDEAKRLGASTEPIETRIALNVEQAQFDALSQSTEKIKNELELVKERAEEIGEIGGTVAEFQFRADFAQQNEQEIQNAINQLKTFVQTVQSEAVANDANQLILELETRLKDDQINGLAAEIQVEIDKLEQEEIRLSATFEGEILEQQLANARFATKQTVEAMEQTFANANPEFSVDEVNASLNKVIPELQKVRDAQEITFGEVATDVIKDNFQDALGGIVDGTKDVGDAFSDLAKNIINSLTNRALTQAIDAIFGSLGGGTGNIFGGSGGLFGNTARQGGLIRSGQSRRIAGFNTGGFVSSGADGTIDGRVPTDTSDNIPALLSDNEFVIKAATVKNVGVDFLNRLNSIGSGQNPFENFAFAGGGLVNAFNNASTFRAPNVQRFQTGGLVDSQTNDAAVNTQSDVSINIVNNGSGKQVSGVDTTYDQIRGTVRTIMLEDIRTNGVISQNQASTFGLSRRGSN